ncbi:DNA adenine methylase [Paenarthrobacter nicotinovorans]|uniref:DNA adenine methylase n=1 Tax=Paenarthrobacter nicotinovorans TaxID=29320 RepID=UPI003748E49E
MRYISPLRYPGGKARLAPYFRRLIDAQPSRPRQYAEPFAGGAGAALALLTQGHVDRIHINDINPGIAAFWEGVFNDTEHFARAIETAEVSLEKWHEWRQIYAAGEDADRFDLGFATFFLNRANRSGILEARPIGGLDQTGTWKIDARFNKTALAERVRFLGQYSDAVTIHQKDALAFLNDLEPLGNDTFVYVDPPYIEEGERLYLHAFGASHGSLSAHLAATSLPWVLTYDVHKDIRQTLYSELRCAIFEISHTAQKQHVGSEYMLFSPDLAVPDLRVTPNRTGRFLPTLAADAV